MFANDEPFQKRLRYMIRSLNCNYHEQQDMFQTAILYLLEEEPRLANEPPHTESWYMDHCKFHLLDQFKKGGSLDAPKRSHLACKSPDSSEKDGHCTPEVLISEESVFANVSTADLQDQISSHLGTTERRVLEARTDGYQDKEIAAELHVTRQAVGKHRKKIVRAAAPFHLAA